LEGRQVDALFPMLLTGIAPALSNPQMQPTNAVGPERRFKSCS
jgi:hypothetical protein